MVWESIHLGPFQTEIIEGWVKPLLGGTSYGMIIPLRAEGQPWETKLLPPGVHVLHAYTHLKNGSRKMSLVVRNVSDSHIFLKKGVPVVQVMSASLVLPVELSPEMEAALGMEFQPESMSVAVRQEKLREELNLDGLAQWTPDNAAAVRELVLAYHDVFALENNELGCTSAIEHKIHFENSEPFKERFLAYTTAPFAEGAHLPQRYAGRRNDLSESIPMVQCSCFGPEEGWYPAFLRGLQVPQCAYEEGLVPFAPHSGGLGKHGRVSTFLVNGFQVRLLAN